MHLKPKIIAHEAGSNNKIYYVIQVCNRNTQLSKISKLRYSEFRQTHEDIEKIVSKHKLRIMLPEFPSRKVFSSTNKSQEKISERKNELTQYLEKLLSIQKLHCLQIMKKYYVPGESQESLKMTQEQSEIQICIDRYTLVEDVVIYYVRINDLKTSEQWTFKTRYSELRNVHEALIQGKIKNLIKTRIPQKENVWNHQRQPRGYRKEAIRA